MPQFSLRVHETFASPFRKFVPLADEAKARGVKVIHLNIGQPDFLMPEEALHALQSEQPPFIPYGPASGILEVRKAWCQYYQKFGVNLDPEDLMISTGASEAIYFTLLAIADAGDEIIIPEPFYANYNGFCQMAGVKIVPLYSSLEEGFPIPSQEAFEAVITPRTKAIMLSNPNNPSGKVYSRETLLSLVELARKHDIFLLVDEAYSEFVYDDFEFHSALSLPDGDEHVVVIDSISKRFNACGVRVGFVATRNRDLLTQIVKYCRLRLSAPMLGQSFAKSALALSETYHQNLLADFTIRRATILQRLCQMPEVTYHTPEGAFYIFVKLPIDDADAFCAWLLTDFQHEGKTVMLSPGTGFYATPGKGVDEIRIAYMIETRHLHQAMDCLEVALATYPRIRAISHQPLT